MSKNVRPVTVIVPVYGDLPSLKDCLASLKEHVDSNRHRVMFVNDCGPEVEAMEVYIQEAIADVDGFDYYRNPENLGFVGTCNRAVLELDDSGNDVMLLNSDTIVTKAFLEEMSATLYAAGNIGAVSPRTNNATIATVPLAAAKDKGIKPKKSCKIFKAIKPYMPQYSLAPVAHGFCMLIRREVIERHGLFDTAFGKGYGEEVDLCMRIKEHGWESAICHRAYVFHLEAKSFTLETKSRLLTENDRIIKERYPDYSQTVKAYVEDALAQEIKAMEAAGIVVADLEPSPWKRLLKRNRYVYGFIQKLRAKLKI